MFFRQILDEDLGCASYVIADGGEAAVIDPKWEIEAYLALADAGGSRRRRVRRFTCRPTPGSTTSTSRSPTATRPRSPRCRSSRSRHPTIGPEHTAYVVEVRSRGETLRLRLIGQHNCPFAGTSNDGGDGTRTRDLRRDRLANGGNGESQWLRNPFVTPNKTDSAFALPEHLPTTCQSAAAL